MKKIALFISCFFAMTALFASSAPKHTGCDGCCKPLDCCNSECDPNHFQKAPKLLYAKQKGSQVLVAGILKSVPKTDFIIEFFNASEPIGQVEVSTDEKGRVAFTQALSCTCTCDGTCSEISATATRLKQGKLSDTSEYSNSVAVKKHLH